jgi:hypothetical protein
MDRNDRPEAFETVLVARWCVVTPLMPANFDLKSHLRRLRSISDVLATRAAGKRASEKETAVLGLGGVLASSGQVNVCEKL